MANRFSGKRQNKYGNVKEYDIESGETFDSKWELEVWRILLNLQDKKLISELKHTDIVTLVVNDHTICDFELDFSFKYKGKTYWADAKSIATVPQGFKIKQRLFEVLFETKLHLIFRKKESVLDKIREGKDL